MYIKFIGYLNVLIMLFITLTSMISENTFSEPYIFIYNNKFIIACILSILYLILFFFVEKQQLKEYNFLLKNIKLYQQTNQTLSSEYNNFSYMFHDFIQSSLQKKNTSLEWNFRNVTQSLCSVIQNSLDAYNSNTIKFEISYVEAIGKNKIKMIFHGGNYSHFDIPNIFCNSGRLL